MISSQRRSQRQFLKFPHCRKQRRLHTQPKSAACTHTADISGVCTHSGKLRRLLKKDFLIYIFRGENYLQQHTFADSTERWVYIEHKPLPQCTKASDSINEMEVQMEEEGPNDIVLCSCVRCKFQTRRRR